MQGNKNVGTDPGGVTKGSAQRSRSYCWDVGGGKGGVREGGKGRRRRGGARWAPGYGVRGGGGGKVVPEDNKARLSCCGHDCSGYLQAELP